MIAEIRGRTVSLGILNHQKHLCRASLGADRVGLVDRIAGRITGSKHLDLVTRLDTNITTNDCQMFPRATFMRGAV